VRLVSDAIRHKTAAEWLAHLEAAGIPAGPINGISQALSDVQAQHRAMVRTLAGMPLVGSPVRLDGERADSDLPPPALGQHTLEIVEGLGLGGSEIDRLIDAAIVGR
jgi:crotonobetainyl-CoA:carnitine CoA-transferase CaiB-like acyl-CoA transferase